MNTDEYRIYYRLLIKNLCLNNNMRMNALKKVSMTY